MAEVGELQYAQGEVRGLRDVLADRIADQLQQVSFDVAGSAAVNGGHRSRDSTQPRQQHPGQGDHPLAAVLGGQMNQPAHASGPEPGTHAVQGVSAAP